MKVLNLSVIAPLIGLIVSVITMIYFMAGDQNKVKLTNISLDKNAVFRTTQPYEKQVENSRAISHIRLGIETKFLTNALAKSNSNEWQKQTLSHCMAHYQLCVKEL